MTDPSLSIDPAMLAAASSEPAGEPTTREIAWAAAYGPGTPEDALQILASARARRLLTEQWAGQCPTPDLLDAALAPAASDDDTALHAKAVRTLLTLHTRTCSSCAARLDQLQSALEALDHEIDQVEDTVGTWSFTISIGIGISVGAAAPVRGTEEPQDDFAPARLQLENPNLFEALTGRPRTETDRWPTATITPVSRQDSTHLTVRLLVPAGMQPALSVTMVLHDLPADLRIPLTATPDGITAIGEHTTLAWHPTDQIRLDIEATLT